MATKHSQILMDYVLVNTAHLLLWKQDFDMVKVKLSKVIPSFSMLDYGKPKRRIGVGPIKDSMPQ